MEYKEEDKISLPQGENGTCFEDGRWGQRAKEKGHHVTQLLYENYIQIPSFHCHPVFFAKGTAFDRDFSE